jgi:ABC-type lipoprotein export system ATPase subunit
LVNNGNDETAVAAGSFIVCEGLVKIFKVAELEVVALQGLDLTVPAGEILGIVGASGSGKSTLLNVLGGLDRPSAGRVQVNGVDLLKADRAALDQYRREQVGFIWQQTTRNLLPYLTVLENVEFPLLISGSRHPESWQWAQELVQAVGLWDKRDSLPTRLSGGQQQRVAVALALANRPTLLLGDEPTGELDTQTAAEIVHLLRRINAEYGITVIVVTHDAATAAAMDRVVTIRDGRTSAETVHRVEEVQALLAEQAHDTAIQAQAAHYVVVDSVGRLQLPEEVMGQVGQRVVVEMTDDGILLKPGDKKDSV